MEQGFQSCVPNFARVEKYCAPYNVEQAEKFFYTNIDHPYKAPIFFERIPVYFFFVMGGLIIKYNYLFDDMILQGGWGEIMGPEKDLWSQSF